VLTGGGVEADHVGLAAAGLHGRQGAQRLGLAQQALLHMAPSAAGVPLGVLRKAL
jgi:hypothetical protein